MSGLRGLILMALWASSACDARAVADETSGAASSVAAASRPRADASGIASVAVSAAPTVDAKKAPADTVSFLSVGDIMLSRKTALAMDNAKDPLLPFRGMEEVFASVDFTHGNLEAMFSSSDEYQTGKAHVFNIPKRNVVGLVKHRFHVLNLANNHTFDQGEDGVRTTLAFLKKHNLKTVGVGLTNSDAWKPVVHEVRGVRIGFVGASYSSVNDSGKTMLPYVARMQQPGKMVRTIKELRKTCDFVVASMHAGVEYVPKAYDGQKQFAHMAINAGADIMIAHHPHVVQDTEIYKGKYIFYSLGNFIFDHTLPHTQEGAVVKISLRPKKEGGVTLARLEVIPTIIENLVTPRPASDEEAAPILKRMKLDKRVLIDDGA